MYYVTGKPLSAWHNEQQVQTLPYNLIEFALLPTDRAVLHERIERRFDLMLANGFIDEVKALKARGDLHLELPAIRSVGYRQVWDYLDGVYDQDEMRYRGIVATRQLAKRQYTWLRSLDEQVNELHTEDAWIVLQNHLINFGIGRKL